jgi:hypothetical protein
MKKILVFPMFLLFAQTITAQNTFPGSGNVGIGTTAPGSPLHVRNNGNGNGSVMFQGSVITSHFHYGANEDTYIRGGKSTSNVIINDVGANVYIAHGSSGKLGVGTASPQYRLDVNGEAIVSGWIRTRGGTGWYNETYGGGMYMQDASWVRVYNNKAFYGSNTIRTDGELQAGPNGDRFLVNSAGNAGIGTTAPGEKLHVMGNVKAQSAAGAARLYFQSPYARWNWETGNGNESSAILTRWAASGADGRQIMVAQYDGNIRVPNLAGAGTRMVVADGNGLLFTQAIPSGGSSFNGNLATTLNVTLPYDEMIHLTRQNASGQNKDYWLKVGGDRAFAITDGGTPIARYLPSNYAGGSCYNQWQFRGELKVKSDLSTSCPDYVFEEDYLLPSLDEKEAYIKKHKHLPDVPAAKEVAENGLGVTEMSFGQLKNLEELYLHVIALKKEVEQLKVKNDILQQSINKE